MDVKRIERMARENRTIELACLDLQLAGKPITYAALSAATSINLRLLRNRIGYRRKQGKFRFEIVHEARVRRKPSMERLFRAARAVEASGRPITHSAMASRLAWTPKRVSDMVGIAKAQGLWKWEVAKSGGTRETAQLTADLLKQAKADGTLYKPDLEVMAQIKAEHHADMIDGRDEQDDMPPGIAPRSNRDHAEWGRRKFSAEACSHHHPYQKTMHRASGANHR